MRDPSRVLHAVVNMNRGGKIYKYYIVRIEPFAYAMALVKFLSK